MRLLLCLLLATPSAGAQSALSGMVSGDTTLGWKVGRLRVTDSLTMTGKLVVTGSLLSTAATSAIGYTTGAGGTVTQLTNKATGVTLSKPCGAVTMNAAALAAAAKISFAVTNTVVAATDGVLVWIANGITANAYRANVTAVGASTFSVTVENITAGSLSQALVVGFCVFKGVTS